MPADVVLETTKSIPALAAQDFESKKVWSSFCDCYTIIQTLTLDAWAGSATGLYRVVWH